MLKNQNRIIFFVAGFLLLASFSFCFAFEVQLPLFFNQEDGTLPEYFVYYFQLAIWIAGILAVVMLAVAGIEFIMAFSNPEKMGEAKKRATSAILGLVLVFASYILINTINPKLTDLTPSEPLKQVGGLILSGSGGTRPAELAMADISALNGKYNQISWPQFTTDSQGNQVQNCDPATDYPYLIYWYKEKNFKKVGSWEYIKCGGGGIQLTGWPLSYIARQEIPGVYFYASDNCYPIENSVERPPATRIQSISKLNEKIGSVWIVNATEQTEGPIRGVILFNKSGYVGSSFIHIPTPQGSSCVPIGFNPSSIVIYNWLRNYKNESAGPGVTLFSKPQFTGGSYEFSDKQLGSKVISPLAEIEINYENTDVQKDEQDKCTHFLMTGTFYNDYCLQSVKIDGNYLVLLSHLEDIGLQNGGNGGWAEVFPQADSSMGPKDLNLETITSEEAEYIEIIPLVESFQ